MNLLKTRQIKTMSSELWFRSTIPGIRKVGKMNASWDNFRLFWLMFNGSTERWFVRYKLRVSFVFALVAVPIGFGFLQILYTIFTTHTCVFALSQIVLTLVLIVARSWYYPKIFLLLLTNNDRRKYQFRLQIYRETANSRVENKSEQAV